MREILHNIPDFRLLPKKPTLLCDANQPTLIPAPPAPVHATPPTVPYCLHSVCIWIVSCVVAWKCGEETIQTLHTPTESLSLQAYNNLTYFFL